MMIEVIASYSIVSLIDPPRRLGIRHGTCRSAFLK